MNEKNTPAQPGNEDLPSPGEELVAYLDGELDAADRERVEARLAEDPRAAGGDDAQVLREGLVPRHRRGHGRRARAVWGQRIGYANILYISNNIK